MDDNGFSRRAPLYRIVYDSVVSLPFGAEGEQGMQDIVRTSRLRNAALGISGALYCDGAYFVQFLEGPQPAVQQLFASILADPRHIDVRIVDRGRASARSFAGWQMAWVTDAAMGRALARHPDLPLLRPYRAPEVIATLRRVLEEEGS